MVKINCFNLIRVYGLVIYTGIETKIMQILQHQKDGKDSMSFLKTDRNIIYNSMYILQLMLIGFYVTIILVIYSINSQIFAFSMVFKNIKLSSSPSYILYVKDPSEELYVSIVEFIYNFHLIVPFVWYNLIFFAYIILSGFIVVDVNIIQKPKNKIDIINPDSITDFGKIKYILSDKTGKTIFLIIYNEFRYSLFKKIHSKSMCFSKQDLQL